jgi:pullulanase
MLIAATMVAQGVPFLHAGQEFCGTKNDNGNSYRAGDNINAMNWDRAAINRHIVEYTRKAILLRKRYAGFRLSTREEIEQCLKLSVQDNGIVFYDIHYPDPATGTNVIRVIINPTNETRSFVFGEEWRTVFDENGNSIGAANSYIQVSALSLSVLVR